MIQRASAVADQAEYLLPGEETNAVIFRAVTWLEETERRLAALGVLSPNEDADDISTADLQFILLPFRIAQLQSVINSPQDPSARIAALELATERYSAFLATCDRYHLLGESEAAVRHESPWQDASSYPSSPPAMPSSCILRSLSDPQVSPCTLFTFDADNSQLRLPFPEMHLQAGGGRPS